MECNRRGQVLVEVLCGDLGPVASRSHVAAGTTFRMSYRMVVLLALRLQPRCIVNAIAIMPRNHMHVPKPGLTDCGAS